MGQNVHLLPHPADLLSSAQMMGIFVFIQSRGFCSSSLVQCWNQSSSWHLQRNSDVPERPTLLCQLQSCLDIHSSSWTTNWPATSGLPRQLRPLNPGPNSLHDAALLEFGQSTDDLNEEAAGRGAHI